jgi:hypothetical protein
MVIVPKSTKQFSELLADDGQTELVPGHKSASRASSVISPDPVLDSFRIGDHLSRTKTLVDEDRA